MSPARYTATSSDRSWLDQAACRGFPLPLWFPEGISDPAIQARATCRGCPVRRDCAAYARESGVTHGIWAGFHPENPTGPTQLGEWLKGVEAASDRRSAGGER